MQPQRSVSRRTVLAVLGCSASGGVLHALNSREKAPRFTATTLDGEKFTNDSLKGKVVLIQFWATWCKYCRHDQPALDAMLQEFAADGLVVLAVNVGETKKKVKQYLQESPRAVKIVLTENTNLAAMFAAKAYPLYVLIDKDGNIADTQHGAGGEEALRRLLRKAGLGTGDHS